MTVNGEPVTLFPNEVIITETPREGWAVASDSGATLALDLHVTPELSRAGLAREAIRLIQEARKTSGLNVDDRIELRYEATREDVTAALDEHRALLVEEVLAVRFWPGRPNWAAAEHQDAGLGLTFWLRRA